MSSNELLIYIYNPFDEVALTTTRMWWSMIIEMTKNDEAVRSNHFK
jgi:hypothetical protein